MSCCQKCSSNRVVNVVGKVSDLFDADTEVEDGTRTTYSGYVPDDMGIGSGDYMEFAYCLDCGQIQGTFPAKAAVLSGAKWEIRFRLKDGIERTAHIKSQPDDPNYYDEDEFCDLILSEYGHDINKDGMVEITDEIAPF